METEPGRRSIETFLVESVVSLPTLESGDPSVASCEPLDATNSPLTRLKVLWWLNRHFN